MSNISDYFSLDPTSGQGESNSNFAGAAFGEGMSPSAVNNGVRALAAMLAQATAYKSPSISASLSTNIAATGTGHIVHLVGNSAINSFGTVPGQQAGAAPMRIVLFGSSNSVSSGGSIILQGNQSRKMQPGDHMALYHDGTGDIWREWAWGRADGTDRVSSSMSIAAFSVGDLRAVSASIATINFTTLNATSVSASVGAFTQINLNGASAIGTVIQTVAATPYTTYTAEGTDHIPSDNSIPQSTEGIQLFSQAFTPKSASSTIFVRAVVQMACGGAGQIATAALFKDATASAVRAAFDATGSSESGGQVTLEYSEASGGTSARTYKLRVGASSGTLYINGDSGGRLYGGVSACTFVIEERL